MSEQLEENTSTEPILPKSVEYALKRNEGSYLTKQGVCRIGRSKKEEILVSWKNNLETSDVIKTETAGADLVLITDEPGEDVLVNALPPITVISDEINNTASDVVDGLLNVTVTIPAASLPKPVVVEPEVIVPPADPVVTPEEKPPALDVTEATKPVTAPRKRGPKPKTQAAE